MKESQNPSNLKTNKSKIQKVQNKQIINNNDSAFNQDDSNSEVYSQQFSESIQELNDHNENMEQQISAQIDDLGFQIENQDESFNLSLSKNDSQMKDLQKHINRNNLENKKKSQEQKSQIEQNTTFNNHSQKQPQKKYSQQNSDFHNEIGQQMQNIYSKIVKLEERKRSSITLKQEEINDSINQQFNIEAQSPLQNSYKSQVQRKQKSEIEGNKESWNYIEFDKQGDPHIIKQCKNEYDEYILQIQKNQKVSNNSEQQDKQIMPIKENNFEQKLLQKMNESQQIQQEDNQLHQKLEQPFNEIQDDQVNIFPAQVYKNQVVPKKKSEIEGNPTSWNYIEYDDQNNPKIVKNCQNQYEDYIQNLQKQQSKSKNNSFNKSEHNEIQKNEKPNNEQMNQSTSISNNSQKFKRNSKDLKHNNEQQKNNTKNIKNENKEQKNGINNIPESKQQNIQKEPKIIQQKQEQSKINQAINQIESQLKQYLDHDEQNLDQTNKTNSNIGFDDDLRTEFENENNINSIVDKKQTQKEMMISDKSFKIDLILNHQPTISPDNFRYKENKEKFQIFFKRNSEQIIKQIQCSGKFKDSSNEYVIKFQEFHYFIEKIFENDHFTLLEDSTNLKNIMKNKNISMILSTIFKEFLTIVRKIDEKMIIDEKDFEIGIEDIVDFFEFWIRIDEQILVSYEINDQNQQGELSKTRALQNLETKSQQQENKQIIQTSQKTPIQYQRTQQRLQSLLEGNINNLQNIQKESQTKNYIQQNLINQTLQFLKQQYKKFEKKTLEEKQADQNLVNINDTDLPLIQQKIMSIFKEYSCSFVFTSRKQTFDEISQQSNNMNINSYFRFIKDYELQNDYISGAQIIEVFKRNCNGKYMNYDQYYNSIVKLAELKESCVFVDQKSQILSIAKMLKLTSDNISGNSKVIKYDFKSATSPKTLGNQNSQIPKSASTTPNKPFNPPSVFQQGKLDLSDIQKLSYQQVNSFGNRKSSSPQPMNLQQRDLQVKKLNNKNILSMNPRLGNNQNKKQKNTGENFNPNDLIDSEEEHETNQILDKQYRITKSTFNKSNSINQLGSQNEKEQVTSSQRLPNIGNAALQDQSFRMIKQENLFPKAQSTSPPHNKQNQLLSQNHLKQPRINGYSNRNKAQNIEDNGIRDQNSPIPRYPISSQQLLQKIFMPDNKEKYSLPNHSLERNQKGINQYRNSQSDDNSEEAAIQDAALKSTKFRNFLKNQAISIQKNIQTLKQMQSDYEQNIQTKVQNDLQKYQKQYMNEISENTPLHPQQIQQQPQQILQKNNSQKSHNYQQMNQQYSNNDGGKYSYGKNQGSNSQLKSNINEQNNSSSPKNKRGSKQEIQFDNNHNQVRVIPVKGNQQFNHEKI